MLLAEVVAVSAAVGAMRARSAKSAAIAALLRAAEPADVPAVVSWLSGGLRQGRVGTGWRTLAGLDAGPAARPSLTVAAVEGLFDALAGTSGAGSTRRRAELLAEPFGPATITALLLHQRRRHQLRRRSHRCDVRVRLACPPGPGPPGP